MKWQMRRQVSRSAQAGVAAAASVLVISVLGACSSGDAAGNSESASSGGSAANGTTLTIGVETGGPYTEFYKARTPQFTEKTGIQVEFQEVPHDNMHERFITEAAAGTGSMDIYQTDQPWIAEFAKQGFLEPLDERLTAEEKGELLPAALEAVTYENKIYGLPYLVHTPILYYRTDLFKQAGITKAPETWDEFREYAKRLTDKQAGVYGTIVEGKQSGEPVTHLLDRFLQAGGSVLEDDKVVLDSQENVDALNYMLAIQQQDQSSPEGAVSYDNADAHNMFMQGKAAMVINWPYMYAMANDPAQSKVAGQFAVAPQPRGKQQASAIWSWGFGISASSKNKDSAMQFLKWATSAEMMEELGKHFTNPVVKKASIDALNSDIALSADKKNAIVVMSKAVEYGKNVTTTPVFPAIQERLALSLSKIMTKQSTPAEELKAASQDIESIVSQ
ncbi:ABC transporter substrate-binding protein [Paenibacillus xerothermodurans]|uniref:Sugar ABC transporter substrate-binding protein n=1 Tax=Paenibacillus xerothermodurans TaxID=1977292 RepID=A0A2W1NDQ3_PAEXE|nr:sugar ABC transporter substrate-binding protein [Paenibacillus xerothermodurans]PZE22839.1 sugar ABC transporter substrate-binding protein [Paenibacillus xerothermodurans]